MAPNALSGEKAAEKFIAALSRLSEAELTILRQATGQRLGESVAAYDVFCEIFRPLRRRFPMTRWACYAVATLYPWHPKKGGGGSLAESMSLAHRGVSSKEDQERAEHRFTRLLDATGPDLAVQLTACVRMLREKQIPVNWPRLLTDLSAWYDAGRKVQRSWADAYFK